MELSRQGSVVRSRRREQNGAGCSLRQTRDQGVDSGKQATATIVFTLQAKVAQWQLFYPYVMFLQLRPLSYVDPD